MWNKIKTFFYNIWRCLLIIEWLGLVLAIIKSVKDENQGISPKYITIKPKVLSDDNMLRGLAALRTALAFIPATAIAAPVMLLGEVGFNIWKRIALSGEYDSLLYPPVDPNVIRAKFEFDEELNKYYGHLITPEQWGPDSVSNLESVYNDFSFITDSELLKAKYPEITASYTEEVAAQNKELLDQSLLEIEQQIVELSQKAIGETHVRDAIEALKVVFPALSNWALFNSEGFNEVLELIDTVI